MRKEASALFRRVKPQSAGDLCFRFLVCAGCVLMALLVLYPVYFILIASVSNPFAVNNGQVWLWPKGVHFLGYQKIIEDARIWQGYSNTIFYTLAGTFVNMLLTSLAAYALSRRDFAPRRILTLFFTFTMLFSGGLIPTYITIRSLHLDNTRWVMLIPFAVNPFNLFIMRSSYQQGIPLELLESAQIEGCGNARFFFSIVFPLSKAIFATIALYYAVARWNDYFTALIYLRNDKLHPLQLVLREILLRNQVFAGGEGASGGHEAQLLADTIKYGIIVISTLPIVAVYPFLQKYFVQNVMLGAVKG